MPVAETIEIISATEAAAEEYKLLNEEKRFPLVFEFYILSFEKV